MDKISRRTALGSVAAPKEPQTDVQDHLIRRTTNEDSDRWKDNRQKVKQKGSHTFTVTFPRSDFKVL